ncbi:Histidine kinase [Flavobacterium fryxellicola]|uniref:Histidine kinase n=1 Tax=Flavobacterium fryxellicola TaxID=249352 RepID=A0A167ZGN9_9FLAO|nr:histidine kinase [Flavobacterium fryxellicola]OAB30431.1 histidine kinase [Flavobacterium fryxellicola]SHN76505.1 Histidine kinase [Flavobacterium fryxellicola]
MKWKFKPILENKWEQETAILVFSFILFTLNDWVFIQSWKGFSNGLLYFFVLYFHAQLNRVFLLPVLLKKHQPVLYIIFTIGLIALFTVFLYQVSNEFIYKNCFLYKSSHQKTYQFQFATLSGTLVCILGTIQILEHYRAQKKEANKVMLSNQVQLNALKNQFNPHFLFNTMNTLYGISLQYPERTSEMIMEVSQLMRYQVEQGNKEFVSLENEIAFISSYIQLEKERVGYRCRIDFDYECDQEGKYEIAPMVLITFIENAFKHGAATIEKCFVTIDLKVIKGKLHMNVANSVPQHKKEVVSTKIGLKNTTERLEIVYPKKHQLEITQNEHDYTVNLVLELRQT